MSAVQIAKIVASLALLTILIVMSMPKKSESEEENYATTFKQAVKKAGKGFSLPKNWR